MSTPTGEPVLPPVTSHDLVVVVPGIMGSELAVAETGEDLWSVRTLASFLRGASLGKLHELRVDDQERGGHPGRVKAVGLMQRPWWLPGVRGAEPYGELVAELRRVLAHPAGLVEFAYDWRLSVDVSARQLADVIDQRLRSWRRHPAHRASRLRYPARDEARVVLVAHSMGGLVCQALMRHMDVDDIRIAITLGTPFEGSVDSALVLNTGRLDLMPGPLRIPEQAVRDMAATLPGLHDLLPRYRCLAEGDDVRALTPHDIARIGGDAELAEASFRWAPDRSAVPLPDHRAFLGIRQETPVTMAVDAGVVRGQPWAYLRDADDKLVPNPVTQRPQEVPAEGDGRVYDYAASIPAAEASPVVQQHAALARSNAILADLTYLLTHDGSALDRDRHLGTPPVGLGVASPDLVIVGESFDIRVAGAGDPLAFSAWLEPVDGATDIDGLEDRHHDGSEWLVSVTVDRPGLHRLLVSDGGEPVATLIYAHGS